MKKEPDIHKNDAMDYESYLRGGFKPDPEIVKWRGEFLDALRELGFDEVSALDIMDDSGLKLRYDIDPADFADSLRFCDCSWVGTMDELVSATGLKSDVELICCPDCGREI